MLFHQPSCCVVCRGLCCLMLLCYKPYTKWTADLGWFTSVSTGCLCVVIAFSTRIYELYRRASYITHVFLFYSLCL
jgi:hypothetical protein